MYSGAKTGLVLNNVKQEQQELKKQDQESMEFEGKNVEVLRIFQVSGAFIFLFLM